MGEINPSIRIIIAIFSGALAVVFFHEPTIAVFHLIHLTSQHAYPTDPTIPMWMPAISSRMFWGGVFAIGVAFATAKQPGGLACLKRGALFGAIFWSLVTWIPEALLKGLPLFDGLHVGEILTTLVANGIWGFGTALLIIIFSFLTVNLADISLT
ncbi:MAG: hypothetical protein KGN76_02075 [Acidobacteriota bacterium]|nr:hypothetical protein [Acidobacteriota bacterium]